MPKLFLLSLIFFYCSSIWAYQNGEEFCQNNPINGMSRFHEISDSRFSPEKIIIHSYTKKTFDQNFPTVLFFTGGPGASPRGSEFDLPKTNIIFFESRGMGCSRPNNASLFLNPTFYSSESTARDALQILNDYQVNKAFIYGHSYGTVVASMFAHLFPERTQKLILEGVIGSGGIGIWNSERRKNNLQKTFSALPAQLQKKITFYSQSELLPKNWYSNIGTMMSYLDDGYNIYQNFLENILSMEEESFISFVNNFYAAKGFLHIDPKEASDGEVVFGMITCQELKALDPKASFYLNFNDHNILEWDHQNTTKTQYCDPLGIKNEKSETDLKKIFHSKINVPIIYLIGEDDGATDLEEAMIHLKNRANKKADFYVLKNGGHLPNLGALKEDRQCHNEEDCQSLKVIRTQKELFLELLNQDLINLDKYNQILPLSWEKRFSF